MTDWRRCPDCGTWALAGAYPSGRCLRCAADARAVDVVAVSEVPTETDQSFKVTHRSTNRLITRVLRLEPSRSTGQPVWVERALDKHNDWYHERIVDPDQHDPIREVAHPLTMHRGRGRDIGGEPFADLVDRGLELFADVRGARRGFIWHVEVWRNGETESLQAVLRDRHGETLPGVPDNARGLMHVVDAGQGPCDRCDELAFHLSRRGSKLERYCFYHLFG